jgi:hypothetical protein
MIGGSADFYSAEQFTALTSDFFRDASNEPDRIFRAGDDA